MRWTTLRRSIGFLGLATALLNGVLWCRVVSGPDDANAVGLIFVCGVLTSSIPAFGLLGPRHPKSASAVLWLLMSSITLLVFLGFVLLAFVI